MSALQTRMETTALLMGLALFAAACDNPAQSGGPTPGPQQPGPQQPAGVASVEIAPDSFTLLATGGHRLVQATPRDHDGTAIAGRWVSWVSSDVTVATVDASGNVTAHNPGHAVITATVDGRTAQARVQVLPLTVHSLTLTAPWIQLHADVAREIGVTLRAADGRVLYDRAVAWTSSDTSVATVNNVGHVRGVAGGRAWVTAESEGRTARIEVIVPLVKEMRMSAADTAPVPVVVRDAVVDEGGGHLRRVRVEVVAGTLSFHTRDRTYQQRVTLRTYERRGTRTEWGSQVWEMTETVQERVWHDAGRVERNLFTGEPIFASQSLHGLRYYAVNAPADGLLVWQSIPGTNVVLPYLYQL